jgi:hypothetical protein
MFCRALLIPFEITALTTVLGFWSEASELKWAIPIACIVGTSRLVPGFIDG